MPELAWNSRFWDGDYNWISRGEEWSRTWGGSEPQWFGSLFPRLHRFIPARRILEIAPGYGRWTKFLIPQCQDYTGIDLSAECIASCKEQFSTASDAHFYQNDGLSLSAADGLYDLIFSFDSLVHVETDVLERYVPEILSKLSPAGVAFIHHSNLAALPVSPANTHARGENVSAANVSALVTSHGGKVILQELVDWGGSSVPLDCLTLFGRAEHPHPTSLHIENQHFMNEAMSISAGQSHYSRIAIQDDGPAFETKAERKLKAECASLRGQLEDLYASSSWRLTRPFRAIKTFFAFSSARAELPGRETSTS